MSNLYREQWGLRLFLFLLVILVRFNGLAYAADFQAKVIHISDGDTITVLNKEKEEIKIRLNGIDCPEAGQAFGNKAKEFTKGLVAGQMVTIQAYDQDKYGRTIGDVVLNDGRNLSQELVKAGMAWWFFKYSDDEQLGILEVKAKIARVGLWADPNPIPPWIFRHPDKLNIPLSRPPPKAPLGTITPSVPSSSLPILGNRRSHKYHRSDCPSYHAIAPKNRVPFESPQDAEEAGFTLAGNCP
ncbi:MAG: thermonuclease family protein [Nitrospirales bacterium]|nr:thermonuclease family protein [Nitrospirales bacterium]